MRRGSGASLLGAVAERLGTRADEVVFGGGQVTELLISDPASESARPTFDVDVVIAATTRAARAEFEAGRRALGYPGRRPLSRDQMGSSL